MSASLANRRDNYTDMMRKSAHSASPLSKSPGGIAFEAREDTQRIRSVGRGHGFRMTRRSEWYVCFSVLHLPRPTEARRHGRPIRTVKTQLSSTQVAPRPRSLILIDFLQE